MNVCFTLFSLLVVFSMIQCDICNSYYYRYEQDSIYSFGQSDFSKIIPAIKTLVIPNLTYKKGVKAIRFHAVEITNLVPNFTYPNFSIDPSINQIQIQSDGFIDIDLKFLYEYNYLEVPSTGTGTVTCRISPITYNLVVNNYYNESQFQPSLNSTYKMMNLVLKGIVKPKEFAEEALEYNWKKVLENLINKAMDKDISGNYYQMYSPKNVSFIANNFRNRIVKINSSFCSTLFDPFSFSYIYNEQISQGSEKDLEKLLDQEKDSMIPSSSSSMLRRYRRKLSTYGDIALILLSNFPSIIFNPNNITVKEFAFDMQSLQHIIPDIGLMYKDTDTFYVSVSYVPTANIEVTSYANGTTFKGLIFTFQVYATGTTSNPILSFSASIDFNFIPTPYLQGSKFQIYFIFDSANAMIISSSNPYSAEIITDTLQSYLNIGINYYFSTNYKSNILGNDGIPVIDDLALLPSSKVYMNTYGESHNIFIFNVQ